MTQGEATPGRAQRARLICGRLSCLVGLLLAAGQVLYTLLLDGGANVSVVILGIPFCILGYYLDSRKLATASIFLCVAAMLFGMAFSQGVFG